MHIETSGDGEPVVLLHGIPGSGAIWEAVTRRLTQRVVVPDLIGFGRSPRAVGIDDLDPVAQVTALEQALAGAGVGRAVFAAHDYGVPVALTLYGRRPDLFAGLVLAAGNAFTDTPIPLPIRAVTWPLVGGIAGRLLFSGPSLALMLRQGSTVALDRERYLGDDAQRRAIAAIFTAALRELERRYAELEAVLTRVDVPTVVIWGDEDPFFPLREGERLAAAIRGARLRVVEGRGHFLPEEAPVALADAIASVASAASAPARA